MITEKPPLPRTVITTAVVCFLLWVVAAVVMSSCTSDSAGDIQSKPPRILWEVFDRGPNYTKRSKVPGGWLVETANGLCFCPDPKHRWASK